MIYKFLTKTQNHVVLFSHFEGNNVKFLFNQLNQLNQMSSWFG